MTEERFDFELNPLDIQLMHEMQQLPTVPETDKLRAEIYELQAERCQMEKYTKSTEQQHDDLVARLNRVESTGFMWQCLCWGAVLGLIVQTVVASILWGR